MLSRRRVLIALALVLALTAGLVAAVHLRLSGESTRIAAAARISRVLDQPVIVGGVRPRFLPSPALVITDIVIGQERPIRVAQVRASASLSGLVAGRIEDASVVATGVRLEWPLPAVAFQFASGGAAVREVVVDDLEVVVGVRQWQGELVVVPDGAGWRISRLLLSSDGAVTSVSASGPLTEDSIRLDPLDFEALGGQGTGALDVVLGPAPHYRLRVALDDAEVARAASLAGLPGAMSGRLRATAELEGPVTGALRQAVRGVASIESLGGTVRGLGLVGMLGSVTSRSSDGLRSVPGDDYERAGLTLTIGEGVATTRDFRFDSPRLVMTATAGVALDGSAVRLDGQARLADGSTVPATITGPVRSPEVTIGGISGLGRVLSDVRSGDALGALRRGLGQLLDRRRAAAGSGS